GRFARGCLTSTTLTDCSTSTSPSSTARASEMRLSPRRGFVLTLLLAAAVFAVVAPTLPWLEFSGSMENLNVATALEIRRSGQWFVPMLEGEPRIAKPPLAAWMTAAAIPPRLIDRLSSRDPSIQDQQYRRLALIA